MCKKPGQKSVMGSVGMQEKCVEAKFRMILMVHREFLNNLILCRVKKVNEQKWKKLPGDID